MEFETGLTDGTLVSFAGGSLRETATVVFVARAEDGWIILTDRSPFHTESLTWPDQPGDRGWLVGPEGGRVTILGSREGVLHRQTGVLSLDDAARALRRGDPDLAAVVVHLADQALPVGASVTLEVEAPYRAALSLQHTGVHLAALALNRCAAAFWTKEPGDPDSLGAPNLDKAAVTRSEIGTEASTDGYRLGKSLRKKGFDAAAFVADLPARSAAINAILQGWLATPAPVVMTPAQGPLGDRRHWSTRLDGAEASMPCGGTHVADLAHLAAIDVTLEPSEDGFVMRTQSWAAA